VPRRSGSINRGVAARDALRDGNSASMSTDMIASVALVYTARTIGLDSAIFVWSWDWWHGEKVLSWKVMGKKQMSIGKSVKGDSESFIWLSWYSS
jgi:hypothetical protein